MDPSEGRAHRTPSGGEGQAEEPPADSERARRVQRMRTKHQRRWADLQVEEAMRRGDFEGLPGSGQPLQLGDRHDPDWWIKRLIEREQIEAAAPPAIALRLEDERLDAELDREISEREVRRRVADFNRRIVEARRQLLGGPPVITSLRDPDLEVRRWRERREARRVAAAAERAARRDAAEAHRKKPRRASRAGRARWRRRASQQDGAARGALLAGLAVAAVLAGAGGYVVLGSEQPAPAQAAPEPSSAASAAPEPSATPAPTEAPSASRDPRCSRGSGRFEPASVTIPGLGGGPGRPTRRFQVVFPPRDANGIPGTPPLTTGGKTQMAFDRANRIPPGAEEGNALFNAHTWPDGSALGNALLRDLRVGDRLVVRGRGTRTQCYRLVRRVQVPATVSGAQYYRRTGPPRMAIVVCSGTRSPGGGWSHRTLFFAKPVE